MTKWHNDIMQHIAEKKAWQAAADAPDTADTELDDDDTALDEFKLWKRRGHGTPPDDAQAAADSEMAAEVRAATVVMTQEDLAESLFINQMVGITNYARALESLNRVTMLKALQRIKDSKGYKTMVLVGPDGSLIRPKTWAGLCEALSLPRSTIDQDLENFAVFGAELLEAQKSLGIGYRELRALRGGMAALPEEQRLEVKALIADAAESNDKEVMLATLEEIEARNQKLSKERDEALADVSTLKKHSREKSEKIDDLKTKLERALNPASEDERQQKLAEARQKFRDTVSNSCNMLLYEFVRLRALISNAIKDDTEEKHGFGENMICIGTLEHINNSLTALFDELRTETLSVPNLDVRFPGDGGFDFTSDTSVTSDDLILGDNETQQ